MAKAQRTRAEQNAIETLRRVLQAIEATVNECPRTARPSGRCTRP